MMLLTSLIAIVVFVQAIKTDNGAAWAYFGIFSGLAIWITFYSVVLTFSFVLFALVERRRRLLRGFDDNRALCVGAIFFLIVIMPLAGMVRELAGIHGFMGVHGNAVGGAVVLESFNLFSQPNAFLMGVSMILLAIGIAGLFRYDARLCSLLLFMIAVPIALGVILSFHIAFEPPYVLLVLPAACVGAAFSCTVVYNLLSRWIMVSRLQVLVGFLLLFAALNLPMV